MQIIYTQKVYPDEDDITTKRLSAKSLKRKPDYVDLSFENLQYIVQSKNPQTNKLESRTLINNLSGCCYGGEVTAILGSSGAGKTTLLNILACRVPNNNVSKLTGKIMANGSQYDYEKFCHFASYVMQNDVLFETMTPKEAFQFVANLKYINEEERQNKVKEIIKKMRLDRCQNALIGGISIKGISGGERKRTSIGFELVQDPQCMLLDEPTSGLDSFTAFAIIYELKQLAQDWGKTIVFTIHSPSTDIFMLFDRIMLLIGGKFIYQGKKNNIVQHFDQIGFKLPGHTNPMDYYLSLMHQDNTQNIENFPKLYQGYEQICLPKVQNDMKQLSDTYLPIRLSSSSKLNEIWQLCTRSIRAYQRDPLQLKIRILQAFAQGLLQGGVFYGVAENDYSIRSLQQTSSALFFTTLNVMIASILSIILSFGVERNVIVREENSKLYTIISYFLSKQVIEIPLTIILPVIQELIAYWMCSFSNNAEAIIIHLFIAILNFNFASSLGVLLGCIFEDLKALMGIAPYALLPIILFSGFFANPKYFYSWTRWLQYVSPIKYSFEALSRAEYKGQHYETDPIEMFDFDVGLWESIAALIGFIIVTKIVSVIALYILKSKQQ